MNNYKRTIVIYRTGYTSVFRLLSSDEILSSTKRLGCLKSIKTIITIV